MTVETRLVALTPRALDSVAPPNRAPTHRLTECLAAAGYAATALGQVSLYVSDYAMLAESVKRWQRGRYLPPDVSAVEMPRPDRTVPRGFARVLVPAAGQLPVTP